ncbi:Ltp family lipoprotein [Dehalobacterium formicoaceticum]|uniref:Ltp family lipoprotein n=1 Tax=Dehalobacterium formicoaceticum TaxID=51515 RepID=A0ABT1Y7L8_9FIRM|nr:Ltp family lipoprotein [Dehalobacterium formicoaceticum]MCR6546870.1 Ltp family lipoprotein [Dehalobacterium formicoaceticum]
MNEKQRKPIYKRWWFIAIIAIFVIGAIGSIGEEDATVEKQPTEQVGATADADPLVAGEPKKEEPVKADVPREFKNALKSAQNYVNIMPFSKEGLYDQLTSEYGDQYPAEAAQYAIENVQVDYNEEALEAAKNYQKIMPMSDQELFDQLTSEHGDNYTDSQAQYAIDNLPE